MKKLIVLLLAAALLLTACSPSTKFPMTSQHEKYGRKALEIADAYLDFDLTLDEAKKKLDELEKSKVSLPEPGEDEKVGSISMEVRVGSLQSAFFHAALRADGLYGLASEESADILKARNGLAEALGVKAR